MRRALLSLVLAAACFAQRGQVAAPVHNDARQQNLEDADAMIEIARAMSARIEKESPWVISVQSVKDADKIQEIAKRIQARLQGSVKDE